MKLGTHVIEAGSSLFLLAGPCVIEDDAMPFEVAQTLKDMTDSLGIPFVFKASFDKANRTSLESFRGPGPEEGISLLEQVKEQVGCAVMTDIHKTRQAELCAGRIDVLQVPAFLCRQTDLLLAAGQSGCTVNIKKGQFMAPWDIRYSIDKVTSTGNEDVMVTERGVSFGYNTLVSDMRAIPEVQKLGVPVVFDATHSVQQPSGSGGTTGGDRSMAPTLAKAAVAAGCNGIFTETHPNPDQALSDGPNMIPLDEMDGLLKTLVALHSVVTDEN